MRGVCLHNLLLWNHRLLWIEVIFIGSFEQCWGLHGVLSPPEHELCCLVSGSNIWWVIWSLLMVELGDPVWSSLMFGNTCGFNDHWRSSTSFWYAQNIAVHPKAVSSGKHFIKSSTWYVILTSWIITFYIQLLSINSICLHTTPTTQYATPYFGSHTCLVWFLISPLSPTRNSGNGYVRNISSFSST